MKSDIRKKLKAFLIQIQRSTKHNFGIDKKVRSFKFKTQSFGRSYKVNMIII